MGKHTAHTRNVNTLNKVRSATAKLRQSKNAKAGLFGENVIRELNTASRNDLAAPAMRILRSLR